MSDIVHPRQPIRAMSEATRTVISMFRELTTPEHKVTKEELSAAIGHTVTYGSITTAKQHLLNDYGMNIEWDRTEQCFRNMKGTDNIVRRRSKVRSMRRMSGRERAKLSAVDFATLPDEQKVQACALASIFGVVAHLSEVSSVKKIEGAVVSANTSGLSVGSTLSLFNEATTTKPTTQSHGPENSKRGN